MRWKATRSWGPTRSVPKHVLENRARREYMTRARRYAKARGQRRNCSDAIAAHSQPESGPNVQAMTMRSCLVVLLMAAMLPDAAHARPWRPAHVVVVIEENHGYERCNRCCSSPSAPCGLV